MNVDEVEGSAAFVDFMSTAETMDERAEELSTLLGVYAGVIESGEDIPGIIGYGLDPDLLPDEEETLWTFRAEQQWVTDWNSGEISGDEAVQLAADTYEENVPPGE
ncbi:hypothetical protein DJ71_14560 [Halorubrum sp. E3]|nr:hypothetical protein DJ71_14560 [Halorubrum sp. E3]